jgi:hypothetical protein
MTEGQIEMEGSQAQAGGKLARQAVGVLKIDAGTR